MALSSTTYLAFRQMVARRLGDATNVYWPDVELKRYCLETFRTWNALAWYSRSRFTFNTAANTTFYDLPSQSNSLLTYNLEDQDIFQDLQAALTEPLSAASWTGTDMFDLQTCQDAIEKVHNDFLLKTAVVATHQLINVGADQAGRVQLADAIVHVRRAAWAFPVNLPAANPAYTTVHRGDEFEANALTTGWQVNPGTPLLYSPLTMPVRGLQLIPPPATTGKLSVVSVNLPAALNIATGVLLNVPDDLAWIIKWGALAYLLSREGQAQDEQRAAYCKARYDQGLQIAMLWNTLQQVAINGVPVLPVSLVDQDLLASGWQTTTGTGQPTTVIVAAPNLIAVSPVPDGGNYSLLVDTVRNHPVPVADTDFIQVQDDLIASLVDYTAHIASFKKGGKEFTDTLPLMTNMLDAALFYNHTLAQEIPQLSAISRWTWQATEARSVAGADGVQVPKVAA